MSCSRLVRTRRRDFWPAIGSSVQGFLRVLLSCCSLSASKSATETQTRWSKSLGCGGNCPKWDVSADGCVVVILQTTAEANKNCVSDLSRRVCFQWRQRIYPSKAHEAWRPGLPSLCLINDNDIGIIGINCKGVSSAQHFINVIIYEQSRFVSIESTMTTCQSGCNRPTLQKLGAGSHDSTGSFPCTSRYASTATIIGIERPDMWHVVSYASSTGRSDIGMISRMN